MLEKITLNVKLASESIMPEQPEKKWYEFLHKRKWEYQDITETNKEYLERMFKSNESKIFLRNSDAYLCRGDISLRFNVLSKLANIVYLAYKNHQENNMESLENENPLIGLCNASGLFDYFLLEEFARVENFEESYDIINKAKKGKFCLIVMNYQDFPYPTEYCLSKIREKQPIDKLPIIVYTDELSIFNPEAKMKCEIAGANYYLDKKLPDILNIVTFELKGRKNNRLRIIDYNIID